MNNLNSLEKIKEVDKNYILESIQKFPDQFEQAWYEMKRVNIEKKFKSVDNVVLFGMGGSGLGGRIDDSFLFDRMRVPFEIFNGYTIPSYLNKNTLSIIYSYSGDTEETIENLQRTLNQSSLIFVITTGGKLKEIAEKENIPAYLFNPIHNPSNQPRMALGYAIASILALLNSCGLISIDESEINDSLSTTKEIIGSFDINISDTNIAKELAKKFINKIFTIFASEHLIGSAHAFKNIINETAKTFSVIFEIPELNHHLLEGLKYPISLKNDLKVLFIESDFYSDRIIKRYKITQDVVKKNLLPYVVYKTKGSKKLSQTLEVIILGLFTAYYMAIMQKTDPASIPWVDYFKNKLAKT